jgi:hypothetical protein
VRERLWHPVQRSCKRVAPSDEVVDEGAVVDTGATFNKDAPFDAGGSVATGAAGVLDMPEEQAVVSMITDNKTINMVANRFLIISPWIVSGFNPAIISVIFNYA